MQGRARLVESFMGATKKQRKPKDDTEDVEESEDSSEDFADLEDISDETEESEVNTKTEDEEKESPQKFIDVWPKLLSDFTNHIQQAMILIRERDVDEIPGAKEELIARLTNIMNYFPKNEGVILRKIVSDSIEKSFFPRTDDIAQAFNQILNARTPDQDYIIQEALNGFIASETNLTASSKEGTLIDRLVELFRKSSNFSIIEHQFYNMFGNPNKPRKFL